LWRKSLPRVSIIPRWRSCGSDCPISSNVFRRHKPRPLEASSKHWRSQHPILHHRSNTFHWTNGQRQPTHIHFSDFKLSRPMEDRRESFVLSGLPDSGCIRLNYAIQLSIQLLHQSNNVIVPNKTSREYFSTALHRSLWNAS